MAVVGSAEIVVRAITLKVSDDIKKAFADARPAVVAAGKDHSAAYSEGFNSVVGTKLPASIEQAIRRTNARAPGKEKGTDFATSFSNAVTSGINIDKTLKDIDVTGAGRRAGKTIVDEVDQETRQLEPRARQQFRRAGASGGGGFIAGFKGALGDFNSLGMGKAAEDAAKQWTILLATGQALGAGLSGLVAGLSSVVSGLFAVASAVGPAVGALGVLPGALSAAAQAGIALKLSFSGIGAAVKAGLKPAGAAAASAGNAIASSQQRVADAVRNANRAISDAQTALKGAYRDAADAAAAAAQRVADAEQNLGDAQRATRLAQLALTDARKAGAESLQQLGFSAEDAALAEQRASLSLKDALVKLQAVQNLPPDSRARVDAELAFKEAELQFRESKDHASDLKKENEDAAKKGVDGTHEVVGAKNDIIEAQNREIDAEKALAKARRDAAKTALDNAEKIAAAQLRVARAQEDGARNIAEAQKALSQAQTKATTGVDAYNEALKKLSPQQRAFVKYLISIQKNLQALKAAAGSEFLPKLQTALEPIVDKLFPIFETQLKTTGGLLGDAAIKISEVVTSSDGLKQISDIMKGNNDIIKIAGDVFADLAAIALDVLTAVQPLTTEFAKFVRGLTDGWVASLKTKDGMKKLTDFFTDGGKAAGKIYHIFKTLWDIIMTLGGAAKDSGNDLLTSFQDALNKLNEFLTAPGKKKELQTFFKTAADNTKIIAGLLGSVGAYLLKIGGDPKTGDAFKAIRDAGPYFKVIFDQIRVSAPAFAGLIASIAKLFAAFTAGDSAATLFNTLAKTADVLSAIVGSKLVQGILHLAAPVLGIVHAFKLLVIGGLLIFTIFKGMISPLVKIGKLVAILVASIAKLGVKGAFKAAIGNIKNRINPKAKADAAAGKEDPGAGKFSKNMGKLSTQFRLTSKAKDKFITNLQRLSAEFGVTGGAAGGKAGKPGKTGLARGSAAAKAGPMPTLKQSVVVVPPSPGEINKKMRIVGASAASGFGEGLSPRTPTQRMEAMTQAVIAANKRMLGISSPSKVFLAIGENVGLALAQGMSNTKGAVKAEGAALAASATAGGRAGAATVGAKAAGGATIIPAASAGKATKSVGKVGKALGGIGKIGGLAMKGLGGAFNLLMGPIGMIATIALPLLIEGFKALYKNSAGFRNFIDGLLKGLKSIGDWIVRTFGPIITMIRVWIIDTVIPALQKFGASVAVQLKPLTDFIAQKIIPAVQQMAAVIVPIVQSKLPIAFKVLGVVFAIIAGTFKIAIAIIVFLITKVLIPIFMNVLLPVIKLFIKGVKFYFTVMGAIIGAVFKVILWYWDNVLKPTIDAIVAGFLWLKKKISDYIEAIRTIWGIIILGIIAIWNKYGKPFIDLIRTLWHDRIHAITSNIDTIRTAFSLAILGIRTWWDTKGKPVLTFIKDAFDTFVGSIATIWDGIQKAPATGLRNLINNLNSWLVEPLNSLTSKFGLDIPNIPMPKGLAQGGPVEGPGGPTADKVLIRASDGEYMLRERAASALGRPTLDYINRTGAIPTRPISKIDIDGVKGDGLIANVATWLQEAAGKAMSTLMGKFDTFLPKGDGFIEQLIVAIFEKFKKVATTWGEDKQDKADKDAQSGGGYAGVPVGDVNDPRGRVKAGNGWFTNLFTANLRKAQQIAGKTIVIYQAGFRPATSYSGTSHQGDAIDLRVDDALIRALRRVGIAAGDRTGLGNWAPHVHAIPGPKAGFGAGSAIWQWSDYIRRGGASQGLRSPWGLAAGGTVMATSGGIHALIGEAGHNERVEPLDPSGLSVRDRAMIELLAKRQETGNGGGNIDVRVFIGDQELTNMVDVRIAARDRGLTQTLNAGTKRKYRS